MSTKRGQNTVDRQRQEPTDEPRQESRITPCAATDCPLPGSIKNENGTNVCAGHFMAVPQGWPLATGVLQKHATLWMLAREASCIGVPECLSETAARALFKAATAAGLKFNDVQRAEYDHVKKHKLMVLRTAGKLVEIAINTAAFEASAQAEVKDDRPRSERSEKRFTDTLAALAGKLAA